MLINRTQHHAGYNSSAANKWTSVNTALRVTSGNSPFRRLRVNPFSEETGQSAEREDDAKISLNYAYTSSARFITNVQPGVSYVRKIVCQR